MPNTLDLDDELDDVELIESLQRAFEIEFDPGEIRTISNVGSLFKILERELGVPNGQHKCATAMAFYRLRRALRSVNQAVTFEPVTDLTGFNKLSAKRFLAKLHRSTGLNMPKQQMSWIGGVGGSVFILSLLALIPVAILVGKHIIASDWGRPIVVGIVGGLAVLFLDPGRLPEDCATLGGLANKVAILNYGRFAKLGALSDKASLWENYVELLCELSATPKNEINAETVFFRHQLKAA